ncbi:MAG: DUF2945 domain-containing protein [Candidatus Saccharimonadales bacterium]|nr:DUF2945 domain-containing protein [Candidatus Saccharimonadales bacterium]
MRKNWKDNHKFPIKPGDWVAWRWGNGAAEGQVLEVNPKTSVIYSAGKKITRHGRGDNPAVIIDHMSGNLVIKLASELLPQSKG